MSGQGKLSERGVAQVKSEAYISPSHQSMDANRHSVTPGDRPGRHRGAGAEQGPLGARRTSRLESEDARVGVGAGR